MPWETRTTFDEGGGYSSILYTHLPQPVGQPPTLLENPIDIFMFNGDYVMEDADPEEFGGGVITTSFGGRHRAAVATPVDYATLPKGSPNIDPSWVVISRFNDGTPKVWGPSPPVGVTAEFPYGTFGGKVMEDQGATGVAPVITWTGLPPPAPNKSWLGEYWDDINPFERGFFTSSGPSLNDAWDAGGAGVSAGKEFFGDLPGVVVDKAKDLAQPLGMAGGVLGMLVLMMVMDKRRS